MANFIGGLVLGALGGGFMSFMVMALLMASSEGGRHDNDKQ